MRDAGVENADVENVGVENMGNAIINKIADEIDIRILLGFCFTVSPNLPASLDNAVGLTVRVRPPVTGGGLK